MMIEKSGRGSTIMVTGFEQDQYRAQVALVSANNRLAKAIETLNEGVGKCFRDIAQSIVLDDESIKIGRYSQRESGEAEGEEE
jgi:hypothetical protein